METGTTNKKGLAKVMQLVAFGLMVVIIVMFSMLSHRDKNIEAPDTGFDTVTVSTFDKDLTFKLRTMTEQYDKKGKLSYNVSFEAVEGNWIRVECSIPESYKDKLSKEALYSGSITVAYVEEAYKNLKDDLGNPIEVTEKNKFETLIKDREAYEIVEINFMYKSFVTSGVEKLDDVTKDFKDKYLKEISNTEEGGT